MPLFVKIDWSERSKMKPSQFAVQLIMHLEPVESFALPVNQSIALLCQKQKHCFFLSLSLLYSSASERSKVPVIGVIKLSQKNEWMKDLFT